MTAAQRPFSRFALFLFLLAFSIACNSGAAGAAGVRPLERDDAPRAWLGVAVSDASLVGAGVGAGAGAGGGAGVRVSTVAPGSPADEAGLVPGDIIATFDSTPVEGAEGFLGLMRLHRPGGAVTLGVSTDGVVRPVTVVLGIAPDYVYSVEGDGNTKGAGYPKGMGAGQGTAAPARDAPGGR